MVSPYLFLLGALAYAIGSIPFHRFLGLRDFDSDSRRTHQVRSTSRFLLNVLKGFAIVEIGCLFDPGVALATALGVSFGHNYPIWRTFGGGTGLGVIVGAMLALQPLLALFAMLTWGSALYVFRKRPVAVCTAAVMTPYLAGSITLPFSAAALIPLSVLVIWRHRHVLSQALTPGPKETEDAFRHL